MKIDLTTIDRENFIVAEHIWNGETLYLVIPNHIGAKFTKDTMIFRSSVWNSAGQLVSASFPKFFNFGEHPELTPLPTSLNDAVLMEKLDGSTLIVSKYKGKFIIRTRGTIDASLMELNGHEVEQLMVKYPKIKEYMNGHPGDTCDFSLIFEWVSPLNQIVIRYEDADIKLIGMISHHDYSLWSQSNLDLVAIELNVGRPQTFQFNTIEEMLVSIEALKGQEGIVVYFNNGQSLLKCKGSWYLALHRMKSELANIDGVVELFMSLGGKMTYNEFYQHIVDTFDYELAEQVRGFVSKVCDANKEAQLIIQGMKDFIDYKVVYLKTRKEQALLIMSAYGNTTRSGMLFKILDGNTLDSKDIKKLIFQCLK